MSLFEQPAILVTHIKELVTLKGIAAKDGLHPKDHDLGIIHDAAIVIKGRKIAWVGKNRDARKFLRALPVPYKTLDARDMIVFPGLVDPHTHTLFAGYRFEEFGWRCEGRSYLDIAKKGGGILNSVAATQKATQEELIAIGRMRIQKARSFGITTLEIKSGYGLSYQDELKSLKAIQALQETEKIDLIPTFLGAHAFPAAYKNKKAAYLSLLCQKMIPEISEKKLAVFCDVFIDEGFFNLAQTKKILTAARQHGLKIRIHADEFKALGGTELAASMGAHSADHLIAVTPKGMAALARANTVATLLPGTSFFLGKAFAPARKLIERGVSVALGTDFNPGSCMTQNLPLITTIAVTQMKMTLPEALAAITYNAAKSLGLQHRIGSVEVGKDADLAFFEMPSYKYLPYHFGDNFCRRVIVKGQPVSRAAGHVSEKQSKK